MTKVDVKHSTGGDLPHDNCDETLRPWAELHESVLFEIFSRLLPRPRIMSRLVCKSWNIKISCKFVGNSSSECPSPHLMLPRKIFHPISEEFYPMELSSDRRVYSVIDDWFLLQKGHYALSFYNPFTKTEIKIPNLTSLPHSVYVSSPPTSADWMVAVTRVLHGEYPGTIFVDTIRCGELEWSISKFEHEENFFTLSSCNGVCYKGQLYFLGGNGRLMIHDLKSKKFYFHEAPEALRIQLLNVWEQYLLVCNKKIVAVFVGNDGGWIRVCQWNSSMRKWEVLGSLRKKALFVSRALSVCETVSEESGMDNKIYFTRLVNDHCVFYSMATRKIHTFDGYSSTTFNGALKLYKLSTWIYPSEVNYWQK